MTETPSPSRRSFLRAAGLAALAGVAGCTSDAPSDATGTTTTTDRTTTAATSEPETALSTHAAWQYGLDGETGLAPALADGTLYVGRADGRLVALDPASGEASWTADAGTGFADAIGGPGASPAVDGDTVYVVSGERSGVAGGEFRVAAHDTASGDQQWTYGPDETTFLTLLGVHDGRVLAATSDDYLQNEGETAAALDPATGDVQWTGEVGDPMDWAVGAGGVFVAAFAGLRAISASNGEGRWTKSGGLVDGVHVAGDTLVAGFEPDGMPSLAGLDPQSGDVRWTGPDWVRSYTVEDGVVYAGGERVAAFDPADGSRRWRTRGPGNVTQPPVAGRLFVRTEGGLHARDVAAGDLLWGANVALDGRLAVGESIVAYVASPEDDAVPPTLVARDAASGEPVLDVTVEDTGGLSQPAVDGDSVYAATGDGDVFALRV